MEIVESKSNISVDYSDFTDKDQDFITVNGQFTLTNPDTISATVHVDFVNLPSGYNATPLTDIILTPSENRVVQYSIQVPHKQDSGEKTIGTIRITDVNNNNALLDQISIVQETKSMLEMDDLRVEYISESGSTETDSFDSGDELELKENVKPGKEITFRFRIKNLFDRDYDADNSDISDIILTFSPQDSDLFGANFTDEDYTITDTSAGEKNELVITLNTDDDVEQGEYSIDITLEGEDGQGMKHTVEKGITLSIERERDDVRITKAELSPAAACDDQFSADLKLKNFGTRDQQQVAFLVHNTALGIDETINNIKLDRHSKKENSWEKTFLFPVQKRNVKAGTYYIDATVYINDDEQMEYKSIPYVVKACVPVVENVPEKPTTNVTETTTQENTQPVVAVPAEKNDTNSGENKISSGVIFQTREDPYTKEDWIIAGFVILMAAAVAVIVLFGIILLK